VSTDQPTGRVAVITGASSGIGEATARALAADGHRVALLARRADRIEALADELGDGAIAIEADVTDRDAVVAAAARVQQELGGADILVNNAGVMLTAPFGSDQREEHRRMVETNLLGAMTATEVFLDQLRGHGGDLVNVSSVAGRVAPAGSPPTRRPSGGSTAGQKPCASSFSPTSASRPSSPVPSRPSWPTTSPTPTARRRPRKRPPRSGSPHRTSPTSSPSPSAGRSA
jgi:NAD(P)-dependent dehydrogenase (short-subunit alcohol dehydrogenase family)